MTGTTTCFVYGTLKSGYGAHNHLMQPGSKLIGKAYTEQLFFLKQNGYPVAIPYEEGLLMGLDKTLAGNIEGELFEVPNELLPGLDGYEGIPSLFDKRTETFIIEDGTGSTVTEGSMYFGTGASAFTRDSNLIRPDDEGALIWNR